MDWKSCCNSFLNAVGEEEDDAALEAPKIYEPIESLEQVRGRLQMQQAMFNEATRGSSMDLVFFRVNLSYYFVS